MEFGEHCLYCGRSDKVATALRKLLEWVAEAHKEDSWNSMTIPMVVVRGEVALKEAKVRRI